MADQVLRDQVALAIAHAVGDHEPDDGAYDIADAVLTWDVARLRQQLTGPPGCDARPWHPADGDTRCKKCGHPNPIWYTDSPLWNRVDPPWGVLCPSCFITLAEAAGVDTTGWHLAPDLRDEATS